MDNIIHLRDALEFVLNQYRSVFPTSLETEVRDLIERISEAQKNLLDADSFEAVVLFRDTILLISKLMKFESEISK